MPDKPGQSGELYTDLCIIGGGAAGFFSALTAAENFPQCSIVIVEQSKDVLAKVRVSGGGRCNVTHQCSEIAEFIRHYPRGGRELRGPFHQFGPKDTVAWFEQHGVPLKTEADGRMFPKSDSSETIIRCFTMLATKLGIRVMTQSKVMDIQIPESPGEAFRVLAGNSIIHSSCICITTGSSPFIWQLLSQKGYTIVPPVPSLFTFNLPNHALKQLMGVALTEATVSLPDAKISSSGPLLITHWGISGPAVLRASSEAARWLAQQQYRAKVLINWDAGLSAAELSDKRILHPKKKVTADNPPNIPARLWKWLCSLSLKDQEKNWASLSKEEMTALIRNTTQFDVHMEGKTTFKEEFVTAGGVDLRQIHFTSFESKLHPGLYLAGEILDIDAVTGGFNFQAAWTGGYLAGRHMALAVSHKKQSGIA